ncbi:MAG: metallophosphoesterase [Thermoleophilia bacterium]
MPSVAVLGDTHVRVAAKLSRVIASRDVDALLFAGDHHPTRFGASRLSAAAWRRSIRGPLNDAVIAVPGNHDYDPGGNATAWRERARQWWPAAVPRQDGPDGCFLADLGYLRVIGLDTGRGASLVSTGQLEWLRALEIEPGTAPVVVLAHAPLFPVAAHMGRSLDADPGQRDALMDTLFRLNVAAYLCGHEHLLAHRRLVSAAHPGRTLHQVTMGGGGAPTEEPLASGLDFAAAVHHVGLLQVAETGRISLEALDTSGSHVWSLSIGRNALPDESAAPDAA